MLNRLYIHAQIKGDNINENLVVDDDFVSRKYCLNYFPNTEIAMAVNGKEAVEAFKACFDEWEGYDLVCLDIMMPEMNGQDVLKEIRKIEAEKGKIGSDSAKIIMTTVLNDINNIKSA
ncbi:MAG: response regulator [Desulfosudis oleivorans]|nr:response regulator [Desulfosudis oleivorans]